MSRRHKTGGRGLKSKSEERNREGENKEKERENEHVGDFIGCRDSACAYAGGAHSSAPAGEAAVVCPGITMLMLCLVLKVLDVLQLLFYCISQRCVG